MLLGVAGEAVLAEARRRAGHVREMLSGYWSGSEELAAPGEPRPQYAPGVPLMQRYESKAEELGVDARTVRRWARSYRDLGEAGLVDDRGRGPARRWRESIRAGKMPAWPCWMIRWTSPA